MNESAPQRQPHRPAGPVLRHIGLAGRGVEMERLRQALVAARDSVRLVVVSGASGVGKSALAAALAAQALADGMRCASGKFDQFLSTAAFAAPMQALAALCGTLLTEPEERLSALRLRLLAAIGSNAGLLTALVPELRALLEAASDPMRDTAAESAVGGQQTERLKLALANAFGATASCDVPLLLLLDDVQWADASTLALMRDLMLDGSVRGLCLLATCRTAGMDADQPFGRWLAGMRAIDGLNERCHHEALGPLSDDGVATLVGDLLGSKAAMLDDIVRQVRLASSGNPLHVIEAVRALVSTSSPAASASRAEPEVAGTASTATDMASLLAARLERLDDIERRLLVTAACMGEDADLRLLSRVADCSVEAASTRVDRLTGERLLQASASGQAQAGRDERRWRIGHDQIQSAVRAATARDAWQAVHLRISDVLAETGGHEMQAGIHLGEALDLLVRPEPRLAGLRRLVRAAEAARGSAAFEISLQLLGLARSLRPDDAWTRRFDETFALEVAWHRALSHLGRYDECSEVYALLSSRSREAADLVGPTVIQLVILQGKARIHEAIGLGMALLRRLSPDLPFEALGTDLSGPWLRFRAEMQARDLESLADAPPADPRVAAVADLLVRIADAGVGDASTVTVWCSLSLLRLWADEGFHESMLLATLYLGLHAAAQGEHDIQSRLASFGMDVARRRASLEVRGNMELGYSLTILPWHRPLEEALSMAETAFESLRRTGDIEMASYAAVQAACIVVEIAPTLPLAEQAVAERLAFTERMNQSPRAACLGALLEFTGRLRGRHAATQVRAVPIRYPYVDIHVFSYRALGALVMGDHAELALHVDTLEPLIAGHKVMYASALDSFAIGWLEIDRMRLPGARADIARLDAAITFLDGAAQREPTNFRALHRLLAARRTAAQGRPLEALELFDAASRAAASVSRPWQHALAVEQAGRLCVCNRLPDVGERSLREAHRLYLLWGATRKAESLVLEFPFLQPDVDAAPAPPRSSGTLADFDRTALYRASQALSSETDMGRLIERILAIVTRLAGATGAFLLQRVDASGWQVVGQTHPGERLPETLMRYASRTLRSEAIADLATDPRFAADPAAGSGPRSVLVTPITDKGLAHAILLLENSHTAGFFTSAHSDTVQLIAGQLSISLQNAEIYRTLEMHVARRTEELQRVATALALRDKALESSSNGVHISELTPAGKVVIYVNPMLEAISGCTAAELIGSPIWALLGPERDQPAAVEMRAAVEAGRPASATLRCYRRDGSMFWNELSISPFQSAQGAVYFVGVHMDVSERMRAAEEDRRRTDRLSAVFELSPDGFVVLDSTARVCIVNPAFCRMTGLVAEDLLGCRLSEFERALEQVSTASGELVERGAFANVLSSEPQADPEAGMGEHGWLLTIAEPRPRTLVRRLRRAHGGPETVIYFRDVTRELEIDRMKSEFLSLAAHELRTPMTSIFGFSELLVSGRLPAAQQAGIHTIIHKQSGALVNLVTQLLDLARINALQGASFVLRPASLQRAARDAIAALHGIDSANRIVDAMDAQDVQILIDTDQFQLAVTNILSNALKYSSTGPVEVDLRRRELAGGRRQIGLRVRDHGIGMSPEQLARLFERFYRADPTSATPGTGLGANIVRDIAIAHKGEVEVASELGRGTTVTLWLDLAED